jgi:hypothetical protein
MRMHSEHLLDKEAQGAGGRSAEDAAVRGGEEQSVKGERPLPVRAMLLTMRWVGYLVFLAAVFAASAALAAGVAVLLNRLLGWPLTWM